MSYGSMAAKVRAEKQKYPTRFCSAPGCLWRIESSRGHTPCRKHKGYATTMMALANSLAQETCGLHGETQPCSGCEIRMREDTDRYFGREAPAQDMEAGLDF